MRSTLLILALVLTAAPALAGSFTMDLPHLTWPTGDVTSSTKNCTPTASEVCR
ncbi:MAG: hypothetical protein JXR75_07010 [Rhodobacteraceae bacterium]|nr:hypothetical protein [Paracoccaceae bacterium]